MKASLSCRFSRTARAPQSVPWWTALVLGLGLCRSAPAFEVFEGFQVHGFLSQGYFLTTNNNLFGSSERGGSLDFTEIGVNASWVPRPNLQLAVQFLSRRVGEASEGEPDLDFGLLDYTALSTAERRVGVRLGRVRLPFGLFNEIRDVAFARSSILLPQSVYLDRSRDFALSGDGAMFYGEQRSPWGNVVLELGPFLPRVADEETEFAFLGNDFPGELDNRWAFIGRLIYETPEQALRLAVTGASVETGYRPRFDPSNDLGPGKDLFEPVVFSAQYNAEHWTLTGEYARRPLKDEGFSSPFLDFDLDIVGESYYIEGLYRLADDWQMVLRYDVLFTNVDDRDGTEAKARFGIPAHTQFSKDWTFGVRYDITPSLMVRAEYHNLYGTFFLFPQDNPDVFATDKKWDLFALLFAYRF